MPLRSDWSEELCPIRRSLDVLGDPWVMLIIRDVLQGLSRFEELRNSLGIADAVLSRRLRTMVDTGLLTRGVSDDGSRKRQGYAATEAAADLLPVLQQLVLWGEKHTAMPHGGGHMAMIHENCNTETTRGEVCSACGAALRADDMIWEKTWKNARDPLVGPR